MLMASHVVATMRLILANSSLHSADARRRMAAFRIGRIEGPWENFLPPIQGGEFRQAEPSETNDPVEIHPSPSDVQSSTALADPDGERTRPATVPRREEIATRSPSRHLTARTEKEIESDQSRYPPLAPATQARIVEEYRNLYVRIQAEGLFDCNYSAYLVEVSRYALLFGAFLLALRYGWYAAGGLFLGLFWHQLVFTAHDAGHMGITHDFTVDTVIGIIIADFLGGLSLGWWKRSHNVHHIVTNSPEHDPDIELMPFFAVSHRFFGSLYSTYYDRILSYDDMAKFVIQYQAYLYYPILALGRFNLYFLSWDYLIRGLGPRKGIAWWHRWFELAGQLVFWTWFGYAVVYRSIPTNFQRVVFILVSHIVTMPLHVQITLSHFAMSTADLGVRESFPQRMLRTTMDVDCPHWLDFFHGGLQFQAIHHLFPRVPRHNLRRTQILVQEFCTKVDIPYALYGFVDGNKQVIGKLAEISRQAAILAHCQRSIVENSLVGANVLIEGK